MAVKVPGPMTWLNPKAKWTLKNDASKDKAFTVKC